MTGDLMMELFLQNGPAETTSYMVAGFIVIFGMMALYLLSQIVRTRNLEGDLEILDELGDMQDD
jgi:hypothetical protein